MGRPLSTKNLELLKMTSADEELLKHILEQRDGKLTFCSKQIDSIVRSARTTIQKLIGLTLPPRPDYNAIAAAKTAGLSPPHFGPRPGSALIECQYNTTNKNVVLLFETIHPDFPVLLVSAFQDPANPRKVVIGPPKRVRQEQAKEVYAIRIGDAPVDLITFFDPDDIDP